jgi:restriction system protein
MTALNEDLPRSKQIGKKAIFTALTVLKENGGQMRCREAIDAVGERLELDGWAKERYSKSGYVRWESILHFETIACVKAGFLIKKKGLWFITPEGESAIAQGEDSLYSTAAAAYATWKANLPREAEEDRSVEEASAEEHAIIDANKALEQTEQLAYDQIEGFINRLNPYEFQDLVAALLRGMGYYTPFVAPTGKDGGVDIVAYRDPLGTQSPRIKVQIKHRDSTARVDEVRQLMGLLQKDGDVGIFVSTGGFTPDCRSTARGSHVHVELIDLSRFINLWQEFYSKLTDEDKARLPLVSIYFLAPQD